MAGKVVEAMVWKHASGRTASVGGAVPWTCRADADQWKMEQVGFTIMHPDGTTGIGRVPFKTRAEAQAWVDTHPNFRGMSQD